MAQPSRGITGLPGYVRTHVLTNNSPPAPLVSAVTGKRTRVSVRTACATSPFLHTLRITPRRKPSTRTSARSSRSRSTSRPAAVLMFNSLDRLPRAKSWTPSGPSSDTRSIRTTSAPISARSMAQKGAGPIPPTSTTRTPASGPEPSAPGAAAARTPLIPRSIAAERRGGRRAFPRNMSHSVSCRTGASFDAFRSTSLFAKGGTWGRIGSCSGRPAR